MKKKQRPSLDSKAVVSSVGSSFDVAKFWRVKNFVEDEKFNLMQYEQADELYEIQGREFVVGTGRRKDELDK